MIRRSHAFLLCLSLASTGVAGADTRIVQRSHQDEFSVMGQQQPAQDRQRIIWVGTDRLRMDDGDTSILVRLDSDTLYVINHSDRTYSPLELPIDLKRYLPPGTGQQMIEMMKVEVDVVPSDETRTVGDWTARRYDVTMTSAMVTMNATMWATTEVEFDREAYFRMFDQIVALQPGMDSMVEEMRAIDGLVVMQESVTSMKMMGDTQMTGSEVTLSVEDVTPPARTYDPPSDYSETPFDFMASMQGR